MTQHGIDRGFSGMNISESGPKKFPPAVAPKPGKMHNAAPAPYRAGIAMMLIFSWGYVRKFIYFMFLFSVVKCFYFKYVIPIMLA